MAKGKKKAKASRKAPARKPTRKTNTRRKVTTTAGGGRAGVALERERATVKKLRGELRELRHKRTSNPKRPPREWWAHCLSSVEAQRYARDPAAICNAAWWRMPVSKRRAFVRRLERSRKRRDRRFAVGIAKAERNRAARAYRPGAGHRRENPASDRDARATYERVHWGEHGRGQVRQVRAANPAHGTATELGTLVQIVYETKKKGDRELIEYEHDFASPRPTLAFNEGGLLIVDGAYTVKTGGITG